ncbi:hypothetical protein FTUN_4099 [Frigoriglobus tundricola]|uniref:Uncharacterized protein n=1 Tax=Frigoriglobus tundricola TaxID=2774151 RepID=A0A6M5YUG2_9BACT|nr:hypothetical protein FTUN_4099 [Frigoriglobus tundricola]
MNLGPVGVSFLTEGQADWLTAPVSKTGEDHTLGGSTPPPSASRQRLITIRLAPLNSYSSRGTQR